MTENEIMLTEFQMVVKRVKEEKDRWSDSVRQWFREINKKFDTDFPD